VNGTEVITLGSVTVAQIYSEKKDPDGFLYILYSDQENFGGEGTVDGLVTYPVIGAFE
jgi:hypothetical protein